MSEAEHLVVLVTAGSEKEAGEIAHGLVKRMLAACVNIVPGVTSATANASRKRRERCCPSDSIKTSYPSQAVKKYSSVYSVDGRERLSLVFISSLIFF